MIQATVKGIKPIGAGKVAQIGLEVDGAIENRKAWATERDGSPAWVEGQTYSVDFFEQDNTYNGETKTEKWVKKAQAPRPAGRPGGGAKPDPERTAIERERLTTYQKNSEINRQRDDYRQCLIIAQVCAKAAVDIHLQELSSGGGEFDSTRLRLLSSEIAAVITSTSDEIQQALSVAPIGGGRQ